MLQILRLLSTAFVCAGLAACGGILPGGPADARGEFTGVIATVQPGTVVTRVLVTVTEGSELSTSRSEQLYLRVTKDTEIVVPQADGTLTAGGVRDLVVGARVRARHTGVEFRSNPPQYPATRVEILSR